MEVDRKTERQKKVFRELKERFTKELVLAVLNLDKKKWGWKLMYQTMLQEVYYLWSAEMGSGG